MHIAQDFRTLDYSIASVLIGALFGALSLSLLGAFTSRRSFQIGRHVTRCFNENGRQFAGYPLLFLQLVFERFGLANALTPIETLSLAFYTLIIVAVSYFLLGSIRFLQKRRDWIIWMIAFGEIQAHNIVKQWSYDGVDYILSVLVTPLLWMPSAFGLEILLRLFDNLDIPILLKRTLQAVLLLLAGYLTWTVLSGFFGL